MSHRSRSMTALLAALLVTCLVASGATAAPVITEYLSWGTVTGSCSGSTYAAKGNVNFDPAKHSATFDLGARANGNILLGDYNQDGVKTAKRWFGCKSGSVKEYYSPVVYNHRAITKSWICYGASCTPFPTLYGSWQSGQGRKS